MPEQPDPTGTLGIVITPHVPDMGEPDANPQPAPAGGVAPVVTRGPCLNLWQTVG